MIKQINRIQVYSMRTIIAMTGLLYGSLPPTSGLRSLADVLPISMMSFPHKILFYLNMFFNLLFLHSIFMLLWFTYKKENSQ